METLLEVRATIIVCLAPLAFAVSGQSNSLGALVATNRPGDYRLAAVWSGTATVTVRTGWFATNDDRVGTNEQLRFDMFTFRPQTTASRFGTRWIWKDVGLAADGKCMGQIHSYRVSLPDDKDLVGASKRSTLVKLFGPSHDSTDGWSPSLDCRLAILLAWTKHPD